MATRSPRRKRSTENSPTTRTEADTRVSDLLLLEELHAQLPVGFVVHDAETLEIRYANPPLPGFDDADVPPGRQDESELVSALREVAATGKARHVPELRHESPGQDARWWSATLHRVDTDGWGRIVVTLAVELTDQVRARHLLEERERRRLALRQAIAAVPGHDPASALQRVADALVLVLGVDAAALRLLDTDDKLHLVAASGLRRGEKRRLALEPLTPRQLETMTEGSRHPLVPVALRWVDVRWLETRDERIGTLTIGARSERRLHEDDLALLDAATEQLSNVLTTIERSPRFLRSRSLAMARASAEEDQAEQARAKGLRPRELAILNLYGEGLATDQIAELLVLSPHTVRTHVRNARRRLGVRARADALHLLNATDTAPVL